MSVEKKWVQVTQCENIPLREGRSIKIDTHEIAIFRLGDRFLALDNRCPHRGGPLSEGIVSGNVVVCPLHAWKIDLSTGVVVNQGSEQPCVMTYPVRVCDGVIQIELPGEHVAKSEKTHLCFAGPGTSNDVIPSIGEARV